MKKSKEQQEAENKAAYGDGENEAPTPTEAFINSDGHKLGDLKLFPYTPERMWAADAMGLRYGNLSKAAIRQWKATGTYPGQVGDVAIVIWLCSLEDDEEISSARRDPGSAEQLAADFAVEQGIVSMRQKKFFKARQVFFDIMDEIRAAYGEPEGDEKKTTTTKT